MPMLLSNLKAAMIGCIAAERPQNPPKTAPSRLWDSSGGSPRNFNVEAWHLGGTPMRGFGDISGSPLEKLNHLKYPGCHPTHYTVP